MGSIVVVYAGFELIRCKYWDDDMTARQRHGPGGTKVVRPAAPTRSSSPSRCSINGSRLMSKKGEAVGFQNSVGASNCDMEPCHSSLNHKLSTPTRSHIASQGGYRRLPASRFFKLLPSIPCPTNPKYFSAFSYGFAAIASIIRASISRVKP